MLKKHLLYSSPSIKMFNFMFNFSLTFYLECLERDVLLQYRSIVWYYVLVMNIKRNLL